MARSQLKEPPHSEGVTDDYGLTTSRSVDLVPSGCNLLDCVLGGGWAVGRFANIVGDKSTGKTLLAIECVANFRLKFPGAEIYYNETEAAFDDSYAESLGIPVGEIGRGQSKTVEDLHAHIIEWTGKLDGNTPSLYIVDSLDALADASELEKEVGAASYGVGKAKQFSKMFQQIIQPVNDKKVTFIAISQVRDNLAAGMFGKKHVRSGGRALDFYASQVLWLYPRKPIKRQVRNQDRITGVGVFGKCEKNKIGLPFRSCDFFILFNYGVDDYASDLAFLKSLGYDKRKSDKVIFDEFSKGYLLPDAERKPLADKLSALVRTEWGGIEDELRPTRQKY